MASGGLFDSVMGMMSCDDLSFYCKMKILEDLMSDTNAVDSLGLELIELIDCMVGRAGDKSEKRELTEMKLIAFYKLYYPNDFLLKRGIDVRKIFLEYLDCVRYEEITAREAEVLGGFITIDKEYAGDIEERLLNFLDEEDKVQLFFQMNQNQLENAFSCKNNCVKIKEAGYFHRINERLHVLLQIFLVTHPGSAGEFFYLDFPVRYAYENVCADWYWVEKSSYDFFTDNGIISEREAEILYRIGGVIAERHNVDDENLLLDLFYEFVDGRCVTDILFPGFLKCN